MFPHGTDTLWAKASSIKVERKCLYCMGQQPEVIMDGLQSLEELVLLLIIPTGGRSPHSSSMA